MAGFCHLNALICTAVVSSNLIVMAGGDATG